MDAFKFLAPTLVHRERLLKRVAISGSRLISMVAPAGFGKSTVAGMIASERGPQIVCDAQGAQNAGAFAARIVAAAGADFVEGAETMSNAELAAIILAAWASADERSVFVFDNLEAVADQPESMDLLVRLIKASPGRLLVLCSRPPLALVNSRIIPPNEHLRLRIEDLSFSRAEIEALFEPARASAQLEPIEAAKIDRIFELTQGWPVAVLFLRQLDRVGQLERTLDRASGTSGDGRPQARAFSDLYDYLVREVLDSIEAPLSGALWALAAAGSAGSDAAFRAGEDLVTADGLQELATKLPLVQQYSDGHYTVHPLIVSLLESLDPVRLERCRLTAAESYRNDGLLSHAARLYLDTGRVLLAAECLERMVGSYVERNAFSGLEDVLERLPAAGLTDCPRLWATLAALRHGAAGDGEALLREGMALRESLHSQRQSPKAKHVDAILVAVAAGAAKHDVAAEILAGHALDQPNPQAGDVALFVSATVRDMQMGRTAGVSERVQQHAPLIGNDILRAASVLQTDVLIATMCGRFDEALLTMQRALGQARAATSSGRIDGLALTGLANQTEGLIRWLAGGDASGAPLQVEGLHALPPRRRAFTMLLMASGAPTNVRRLALLAQARKAAETAQDLWAHVLILCARAVADPHNRSVLLREALSLAEDVGQEPLTRSVSSLLEGGAGLPALAALAKRFAPIEAPSVTAGVVRVNALSRAVYRDDRPIAISSRSLDLVLVLAVRKRVQRDELAELMWGESSHRSAGLALKMLASRARRQLGDPGLIVVSEGFYSLRDDVVVDRDVIERLLHSIPRSGPLTLEQRGALLGVYDQFKQARTFGQAAGTVSSVEAAIMGTRRHVVARLATDALERGELELAVDLADELRHYDGGDETAYELMIRAYLSSGNTASALREYRNYREHLMHALGIEPPYSMEELTGRTPRQQTG